MLARTSPPYRGWHNASDAIIEGHQRPLGDASHSAQKALEPPTYGRVLRTHQPFFFNYRKTKIPLTSRDNFKKTKVKKPNILLDLRQEKVDSNGYSVLGVCILGSVWFWAKINNQTEIIFFQVFESNRTENRFKPTMFGSVFFPSKPFKLVRIITIFIALCL
jgi:hypothetical protein